jgi:hypothetical protein
MIDDSDGPYSGPAEKVVGEAPDEEEAGDAEELEGPRGEQEAEGCPEMGARNLVHVYARGSRRMMSVAKEAE